VIRRWLFLVLLGACVVLGTIAGDRLGLQWDLTRDAAHSLSAEGAAALDALGTGVEIEVYVPDLPVARAETERLLRTYRLHPAVSGFTVIDPVAEPDRARAAGVGGEAEVHLRHGERSEVVRRFDRRALDDALQRLALRGERWIVTLRGHGEAALDQGPDGLATLAQQLERLGYRVLALDPRATGDLPQNAALVVVAAPESDYPDAVEAQLQQHVERGGAVLWLYDRVFPAWAVQRLGLTPLPGIVVDAAAAAYGLERPEHAIVSEFPADLSLGGRQSHAVLYRARGLDAQPPDDWRVDGRLRSSAQSWNETGSLRGRIARDPQQGEHAGPVTVGVLMRPADGGTRGRVAVVGGAHWIGNAQIGRAGNLDLATGLVRWLTDNRALHVEPEAAALDIRWSPETAGTLAAVLMYLLPTLYIGAGLWLRYRRRRA
jgi:hypothetical protein